MNLYNLHNNKSIMTEIDILDNHEIQEPVDEVSADNVVL